VMATVIQREKGTIDKYIGDAVMAFWNAPETVEHHAILRALRDGEHARAAAAMRAHIVDSLERDARMADVSLSLRRLAPRARAGTTGPHPKEER